MSIAQSSRSGIGPLKPKTEWPISAKAARKRTVAKPLIVFSNGSMGDSSVLRGYQRGRVACVLYVLKRHLMGSAGCEAAWLKSQSVDDRMLHNRRRHPFPP